MKATYRNGKGSANHNDRKYLSATEQDKEEIVSKWQLFKECDSFRENEIKAYEELYGEWLKNRNDKLIKDGHEERCKTVEDLVGKPNEEKRKGRYEVNETILQIGKDGEEVSDEVLRACVNRFMGETRKRYGTNMEWLDVAVHRENSSVVHAHLRRTWLAYDEEGRAYPAKKEALRALGFDVLETDDRFNNATTRHSEAERELWYEICKEYGIDLDTEADKDNTKHLSITEYKKLKSEELSQDKKDFDVFCENELKSYQNDVDRTVNRRKREINAKADKELQNYEKDIKKRAEERKNELLDKELKKQLEAQGLTHEIHINDFSR